MSIFVWLLSTIAYFGYMVYLFRRPSDLMLAIGVAAVIIGFLSFIVQKKFLQILSSVILFFGVIMTYPQAVARNQFWLWIGGMMVILFFGSLGLRND